MSKLLIVLRNTLAVLVMTAFCMGSWLLIFWLLIRLRYHW